MKPKSIFKERGDDQPAHAAADGRSLLSLDDLCQDAGVSYRFLQMEIERGRLVAVRLSKRVLRIRRSDWEKYLAANVSAAPAT